MFATRALGFRGRGALLVAVVTALGTYVAVRAWALSFTHDESFTYTREVRESLTWILFSERHDANNHPLNTLAMKLADGLFGPSELALRSVSVLAFFVYAAAVIVVLRRVDVSPIRVAGLALAVANPYVLDFFSLARGYGLALAAVAASTAAMLEYVEHPRLRTALAALVCAALGVLANYATLAFYVAVLIVMASTHVVPQPPRPRSYSIARLAGTVAVPTAALAFLAVLPLFRLRSAHALYFGGSDGFWEDTARSLVSSTLYRRGWDGLDDALVVLVAVLVAAGAVAAATAVWRRRFPVHVAAFGLLVTAGIVSVAQHVLLDVPYLIERTALFFVPLFVLWLALAADTLVKRTNLVRSVSVAAAAVAACALINFGTAVNVSYALDWRYDASTEHMVRELSRLRGERSISVGASWQFEPTINFYRETRRLAWLRAIPYSCRSECLAPGSDYYFLTGPDTDTVASRGARIVRTYRHTGATLTDRTRQ